jgi:hypothetical protein
MNVKIVLTATAFAGALALAVPTLAQDKEPADQTMAPKHHHGVHHAGHHMTSAPRGRRGSTRDVDAKEREITRQLNMQQLQSPGAPPQKSM